MKNLVVKQRKVNQRCRPVKLRDVPKEVRLFFSLLIKWFSSVFTCFVEKANSTLFCILSKDRLIQAMYSCNDILSAEILLFFLFSSFPFNQIDFLLLNTY